MGTLIHITQYGAHLKTEKPMDRLGVKPPSRWQALLLGRKTSTYAGKRASSSEAYFLLDGIDAALKGVGTSVAGSPPLDLTRGGG